MTRTSTGLVWGFGLVISFVVGAAILFQTLATQVRRHLPAYATLKAMGYTDRYLGGIVVLQAVMMAVLAFLPAFALSLFVYRVTRENTLLPIFMTEERVAGVLAVTIVMSVVSALFALRNLRKADPVDLF
jgi:putative ABC transport system permease protein